MNLTEFNEIRPYNDEELPQIFEELIADPAFRKAATGAIPNVPFVDTAGANGPAHPASG